MNPYFPTANDLYRVLQRELPQDVYADGAPSAFFTTADNYATAAQIADLYLKLEVIYLNSFPQSADERINDWEMKAFGMVGDLTQTLAVRQQAVIAKLRSQPNITIWAALNIVLQYVPQGTFVQIVEYGSESGQSWRLGVSHLSTDTILGWADFLELNNPDGILDLGDLIAFGKGWRIGASALSSTTILSGGNSWQVISEIQAKAYTYEVRIFGYTLTGTDLTRMLAALNAGEPARSGHVIRQGLDITAYGLTVPVANVSQKSGIFTVAVDPTQSTGYSGRTTLYG